MANPKDVLVTCPPMLQQIDEFRARFDHHRVHVHCPEVVQTLSEEELIRLVPTVDGWIIGDDPATKTVFEAGARGRLRAAIKWGVGVDNVDFTAAEQFGIRIANTPGAFGAEVADVAVHYVTALARETYLIDRGVREGTWPKPTGVSLAGKHVALVGFGDIGRQTARRLLAADLVVTAYDPMCEPGPDVPHVRGETWPNGLNHADFIVFTCALTPHNYHMLNTDVLRVTKPGVRIVNVARGPLIDEAALIDALSSGHVHSAALDVMESEPLPLDSALRNFDRCIFGSHNGSNTIDAVRKTSTRAMDLLFEFLNIPVGEPA